MRLPQPHAAEGSWPTRRKPLLSSGIVTVIGLPSGSTSVGSCSEFLGKEADQPRRQHRRVAARLVDRIAQPIVAGARHEAAAGEEPGLLQRAQEDVGVAVAID